MTNLFEDKTPMPTTKEVVSVAMVREETPPGTPRLSGQIPYDRDVQHVSRPRKGHDY